MMAISERRRVVVPVIAAVAVVGLAVLGDRDPGGWMVLHQVFDHSTFAGGVAGVLLIAALAGVRARTWWGRGPVLILGVVLTVLTLGWVFWSHVIPLDLQDQQQIAAPGGHGYRLMVAKGSDLDSIATVAIRTGSGITTREWRFACLNDDDGNGLVSATWDGPARIVLMINYEEPKRVVVPVNPASGRPESTVNVGGDCGS